MNSNQCQCKLKNGNQCKKIASVKINDNNKFCWQHQNCTTEIIKSGDDTCPIDVNETVDLTNNSHMGLMITPDLYETIVINTNDIETLIALHNSSKVMKDILEHPIILEQLSLKWNIPYENIMNFKDFINAYKEYIQYAPKVFGVFITHSKFNPKYWSLQNRNRFVTKLNDIFIKGDRDDTRSMSPYSWEMLKYFTAKKGDITPTITLYNVVIKLHKNINNKIIYSELLPIIAEELKIMFNRVF